MGDPCETCGAWIDKAIPHQCDEALLLRREVTRLRAENERLREIGISVVQLHLREGRFTTPEGRPLAPLLDELRKT